MFLDVSIVYVRAYDECLNIGIWPTMSGNEASERCFAELVTSVEMDWRLRLGIRKLTWHWNAVTCIMLHNKLKSMGSTQYVD
jgi:hypothetical protein